MQNLMTSTYLIHYAGGLNLLESFWALAENLDTTMCRPLHPTNGKRPEQHLTWLLQTDIPEARVASHLQAMTKGDFLLLPLDATSVYSGIMTVFKSIYGLSSDDIVDASLIASAAKQDTENDSLPPKPYARRLALAHPVPMDDVLDKIREVGIRHLNPIERGSLYWLSGEGGSNL
jgi:hypothetical protein